MNRRSLFRDRLISRVTSHVDSLLNTGALVLVLFTAAPAGSAPTGWELALAVVTWIPLLVRTRHPVLVAVVTVALDAATIVVSSQGNDAAGAFPTAAVLALYTVGELTAARTAWLTGLLGAATLYVISLVAINDHIGQDLLYLNWALLGTLVGRLVRERRERIGTAEKRAEQAEATKAVEARRQVTEERMRIARELHDVLAHHITVVNAQAGVAQYLLRTDTDAAETALSGITENTRAALDELRATLGLLRSEAEPDGRAPTPGLDQIGDLIVGFTRAGTDVRFDARGTAFALTSAGELAIYRIAQEALTNASKHAPGAEICLLLEWSADELTMTIDNRLHDGAAEVAPGTGHGLIGMRERAAAAGGTLTVGRASSSSYRVRVTMPRPERVLSTWTSA